jgi:OOP family OmpA-OmpF porin
MNMKTAKGNVWTHVSRVLLAAGCTLALTAPASAQGFYLGASVGTATVQDFCSDLSALLPVTSCDEEDTGWKLYAGAQLNKNAAIEFGYGDFGEVRATAAGGSATVESTSLFVAFVGIAPLGETVNLLGRIGFHRWDIEAVGTAGQADDSGTDLTFGFGASFGLGKAAALRAEWERYEFEGDDVDLLSLGVTFNLQ